MAKEKRIAPVFVYYYDLLKFYTHLISKTGAHMKYKAIKQELEKKDHQYITVKEFAEYIGTDEQTVIKVLTAE